MEGKPSWQFNKYVYYFSRNLIWLLSKLFFFVKIEIISLGDFLYNGMAILAPSHKSWLDIPLLTQITKRNIHYVAKHELYKNIFFKWYLDSTGSIPIIRGEKDNDAIAKIVETLKSNEIVAIYPEGKRHKGEGIAELNNGIGIILLRNKIYPPIYPVVITYQKGKIFGLPLKINIIIGNKIDSSKFKNVKTLMEKIRYSLIELLRYKK